jgi:hypothetical protein
MMALFKAQNWLMFQRREPMLALCTVQRDPATWGSLYAKKNWGSTCDNAFHACFLFADWRNHNSGFTCAERKANLPAAAYEVYRCDVMWWGDMTHMYKLRDWDNDPHVQALCLGYRVRWCDHRWSSSCASKSIACLMWQGANRNTGNKI